MSEADVTFVIDGNDAGLTAAVSRGVRSLRRLDDEMDEVRASTAQADLAMRGFAGSTDKGAKGAQGFTLSAEKMGQGLSLVSPRLGELTAKIGGLGAAGGPLVAAGAGAVAFGAAWAGVVVSMVDAVRNIDDLTEALTEQQRVALDPYIENIETLRDLFDSIGGSLTEAEIRILSGFANGIRDTALAVDRLSQAFLDLDDATSGRLSDFIGRLLSGQSPIAAAEAALAGGTTPGEAATVTPGTGPLVDEPTAPTTTFNMEEDVRRRMAERARGGNTASNRAAAANDDGFALFSAQWDAAVAAQQAAYDEGFALFSAQWDAQVEYAQKSQDAIVEAGRRSVLAQAAESDRLREIQIANAEAAKRATLDGIVIASQAASQLIGIIAASSDEQLQADKARAMSSARTAKEREAVEKDFALRQWRANKNEALAQAAINIPLSVITGLSQGGPVLAAVNGALAAIQLGVIAASQPPRYHVGGYAPDERAAGGMVMRDNERTAVLTAQGQRSLPADLIALANAGMLGQSSPSSVTVVLDGRARSTRRFATNPSTGIARR